MKFSPAEIISSHQQRRLHRVGLTGVITLLARGITWGVSLLSLPWASHHLGRERFGLWLTLVGIVNWFSIANLGVTNSLINEVTAALAQDDETQVQRLVTNAVAASALIAAIILLLAGWWIPRFDASGFFQLTDAMAQQEITFALLAIAICFALRLLAGLTSGIFTAYQESYFYQLWTIVCGLLSAAGLWLAIRAGAGLTGLICGFVGGWLLGELCAAAHLFGWYHTALRPRWQLLDRAIMRRLLRHGFHFWLAQVSAVILLQTDLLVVSGLFGAQAVAEYGTAMRLFNLVGAVQTAFVQPLWSAYGEAYAKRDYAWVVRTFRRSLWWSAAYTVPVAGLIYLTADWLFGWLVTADVKPARDLLLALLVVEIANAIARCIAMLLNGIGQVRVQAIFGPVAAVANLVLSVGLGRWLGSAGVAWATALCLAAFWLLLMGYTAYRQLRAWNH